MKDLIIIGAGGLGREALEIALDIQQEDPFVEWRVKGFITDIPGDFAEKDTLGYEIIGDIANHEITENNVYAFAIADIEFKRKITDEFLRKGAHFVNLVHPSAYIGPTAKIGLGNIIAQNAVITSNVNIGNFVRFGANTVVGHDVLIGDYSTISGNCSINGWVILGKGVFIGGNAVVSPKSKIGNNAKIGTGSVVINNVKPGITVFGNPAHKLDL